jgi:hypothetical protein
MRNGSRLQHYLAVKNEIFISADRAFYKNGTVRAFEINQSKRQNGLYFKYGTARAFCFFRGKTENFRQKIRYASRKVTASVIKILTENGRVRYGVMDKFGLPTVLN